LQTNQISTSLGFVSTIEPQPKKPHINLPNKFDGTHLKFRGFINQMCLVIQFHPHRYPIGPTQVKLIGTLLLSTTLAWLALLLEHQSPLFNNFEAFKK
jgi:hypothetical protein